MTNIQTVWAKPQATTKPAEQPAKPRTHSPAVYVDLDALKIENTPLPREVRSKQEGKYDAFFAKLQPGQCVVCKAEEAGKVSNAMRSYYRRQGMAAVVRSKSKCEDGAARVWLVRVDPKTARRAA